MEKYFANVVDAKVMGVYMLDGKTSFVHPVFIVNGDEFVVVRSICVPYMLNEDGHILFNNNGEIKQIDRITEKDINKAVFDYAYSMYESNQIDVKCINEDGEMEIYEYGDFKVVNSIYGLRLLNLSIFMKKVDIHFIEKEAYIIIRNSKKLNEIFSPDELYTVSNRVFSKYRVDINYKFV